MTRVSIPQRDILIYALREGVGLPATNKRTIWLIIAKIFRMSLSSVFEAYGRGKKHYFRLSTANRLTSPRRRSIIKTNK